MRAVKSFLIEKLARPVLASVLDESSLRDELVQLESGSLLLNNVVRVWRLPLLCSIPCACGSAAACRRIPPSHLAAPATLFRGSQKLNPAVLEGLDLPVEVCSASVRRIRVKVRSCHSVPLWSVVPGTIRVARTAASLHALPGPFAAVRAPMRRRGCRHPLLISRPLAQ
jgi:hypothetical protein